MIKNMLRTFEAEIAEKIRTSSLGKKLGVLIKKKVYQQIYNSDCFLGLLKWNNKSDGVQTSDAFWAELLNPAEVSAATAPCPRF